MPARLSPRQAVYSPVIGRPIYASADFEKQKAPAKRAAGMKDSPRDSIHRQLPEFPVSIPG